MPGCFRCLDPLRSEPLLTGKKVRDPPLEMTKCTSPSDREEVSFREGEPDVIVQTSPQSDERRACENVRGVACSPEVFAGQRRGSEAAGGVHCGFVFVP